MNTPFFSVIVPTCHRNDHLRNCLAALAPECQTLKTDQYEVVVADDGSESTAKEMMEREFPWAGWFAGPRRGPAANRNIGAKESRGEWLVFVDDDCIPEPALLEAYRNAAINHEGAKVLEGRTIADRPRRSLAEVSPVNETGGYLWSCNFAIRRDTFNDLGGFDERFPFPAMEDVDFRYRLKQADLTFPFVPDATVCHPWRPIHDVKGIEDRYLKSLAIYLAKHEDERIHFTFRVRMETFAREVIGQTIPQLIRYRGSGIKTALLRHYYQLAHAIRALKQYGF